MDLQANVDAVKSALDLRITTVDGTGAGEPDCQGMQKAPV